ncbi:MAG: outer membrane protein assembly factor BamE [Alphaproteobacteria bacterium]|nr:MAG: outer membrane protein assembly factor BamE [Alphaproteobacteria bacterium]
MDRLRARARKKERDDPPPPFPLRWKGPRNVLEMDRRTGIIKKFATSFQISGQEQGKATMSARPIPGARIWLIGALVFATAGLGACEQTIEVRGNLPEPETMAKISPGVHTRNDVMRLLGSPSTISTFKDDIWYYVGQKSTEFAFFKPEVLERRVLIVSFDDKGTVAETKTLTLADGREIDPVDRKTPTEGRKLTLFQQLFGNLGRFTAQDNK